MLFFSFPLVLIVDKMEHLGLTLIFQLPWNWGLSFQGSKQVIGVASYQIKYALLINYSFKNFDLLFKIKNLVDSIAFTFIELFCHFLSLSNVQDVSFTCIFSLCNSFSFYLGTGHSYELIRSNYEYTIPKIFLLLKAEKTALFVKVIFWTSKRFGLFSKLRNILVYKIGENRIRRLIWWSMDHCTAVEWSMDELINWHEKWPIYGPLHFKLRLTLVFLSYFGINIYFSARFFWKRRCNWSRAFEIRAKVQYHSQACNSRRYRRGPCHPQILAYLLTLSQPGGQIMPTK